MPPRYLVSICCALGSSCTVTTEIPHGASNAKEQPAAQTADARSPGANRPTRPPPTAAAPSAPIEAPAPALPRAASSQVATEIEIVTAGEEPRTPLRWTAKPGSEQRLTLTVRPHMRMDLDGVKTSEQDLPPMTLVLVARVAEPAAAGVLHLVLEIESAEYDASVGDERTHNSMDRSMDVLRALRVELDLDERGVASKVQAGVPERALSDLRPAVESVLLVIPQLFMTTPEPPVGTGARWKSTTGLAYADLDLRQTSETSLAARSGDEAELAWSTTQTHARVVPGTRPIERLSATAKGTLTLATGKPLPIRVTSSTQAKLESHVQAKGPARAATLILDLAFEATAAK